MTTSLWRPWVAQIVVVLALMGIMGAIDSASAASARLSPTECYRKDSGCTKFCARVTKVKLRYECFTICDRMLDRCLEKGEWSDSFDPNAGDDPDNRDPSGPSGPKAQLLETFMRMTMTLADTDGDGELSPEEMEAVRAKVFGPVDEDANGDPKAPAD